MDKTNKNPNPQGKGQVPVLQTINESRAVVPALPKNILQVSTELFTSLFILHSQFQFKPVSGKDYWLYHKNDQFSLSLVSPDEWGGAFGTFVGKCTMHGDATWSLELGTDAVTDQALMDFIEKKKQEFESKLEKVTSLENLLPFYIEKLPFYQRVYASALANSLKDSMIKSGIKDLSYQEACRLLE